MTKARISMLLSGTAGLVILSISLFVSSQADSARAETATDVAQLMKQQLNPALTEVSDALFHQSGRNGLQGENLRLSLDQLEQASTRLVANSADEPIAYQIHAVELQIAVRGLREAVLSNTHSEVVRFFHLSKATCNSCHASFKD